MTSEERKQQALVLLKGLMKIEDLELAVKLTRILRTT